MNKESVKDIEFDPFSIHIIAKAKRGKKISKDLNPKTRGCECSDALARVHESKCSIYEGGLKHRKTQNGKEIRKQRAMSFYIKQYQAEMSELENEKRIRDEEMINMDESGCFLPAIDFVEKLTLERELEEALS